MIKFILNNNEKIYDGDENLFLLKYLREIEDITSVKDGCSGQATCGACMVEINGKAKLSCVTKMKNIDGVEIITMEGIPDDIRDIIVKSFVEKGAVQCGFCTPGFIMRTKILLQDKPFPSEKEIEKALTLNLCRCTGYKKIVDAILLAAKSIREKKIVEITKTSGKIGESLKKYQAYETAIGKRKFVDDIKIKGMLHSALKFSEHPRAEIIKIDISKAKNLPCVIKIITSNDIPGEQYIGLIYQDWPLMIKEGQITNYIGDVLAGVIAETEEIARTAVNLIDIEYKILKPVSTVFDAIKEGNVQVHKGQSNILDNCVIKRGDADNELKNSAYFSTGKYETQRIEHAFLEKEAAIALPAHDGIKLICQSQGIYEDRKQVAKLLGLHEDKIRVTLIPNGGGFGGKEDMTVQGHVSLFAYLVKKPVKLVLTREESIIMHPKRHPVFMDISLACDKNGKLTALKLRALGDTGAYASVGTKVMERVAGHATAGYYVPVIDLETKTIYTNNIPCGAMRGFGANQVAFAVEGCIDELCEKGGFDRWQFRYDNALIDGLTTATGQKLEGVGIRECLNALKNEFYNAKYAGLACGIKNSGVGNGMPDFSDVKIIIQAADHVIIHHGWTEMGQGVHNMAIQTLCQETGINADIIEVIVDTEAQIKTGMTTSSRATALVGNAIIDAAKKINKDLKNNKLADLIGKTYKGSFICDWTTKPGDDVKKIITHYSYGYAAQLAVLDDNGEINTFYAAHDAGKIMNPMLFEGQIQGAVHMGIGYALSEDLPMENSKLISTKLKDCGVLRAKDTPKIVVKGIEVKDPVGPYGAKGVGEIGLVPTAAAVANALYQYDGIRRYKLPMKRKLK
ncbi:MAG: selenium-dependent xanthine dehydrogenase [Bacteroidales bacterium]|nr:selenium-dependent xanthine dehydrogenase [Bacteroidales bacterium]